MIKTSVCGWHRLPSSKTCCTYWCHTMMSTFFPAILILLMQNGYIIGLTSWPDGRYGLLKPTTGCPEEWTNKDWQWKRKNWAYMGWTNKGFLLQDTESTSSENNSSDILHIEGHVDPNFILKYFCVKRTDEEKYSITWPKGQYCIYCIYDHQKQWGTIEMFYKDSSYQHSTKHVDDFIYKWHDVSSIALNFRCKTSDNKKDAISLPTTKPFYLLPYGSRECQQVKWMVATSEWIKYHTDNYKDDGRNYISGTVPYHELGDFRNKGITMYYCYYESCNYTLRGKEGVFQSPGFPGKYPDGQLCSWRIMVPTNYTVNIHFTNFSLYGNKDILRFYKMMNGLLSLNYTFHGRHQPRQTLTATSNVTFVFSTDSRGSSTGFRAKYRVVTPNKITTTPLATTTNLPTTKLPSTKPTTTDKPTTTKPTTTKRPFTAKLIQTNTSQKPKPQQRNAKKEELTRKITQTPPWNTSGNGASANKFKGSPMFSCADKTSKIVVMVIPLVCCILVVVLVVDIVYRCRRAKNKGEAKIKNSRNGDCLAVNMTYERGDIILDQPADNTTDTSTVNTADDHPQQRDDPPDYEDVDYTQLNEVPPSKRSTKRHECHALEPVGNDASSVFYHVLEPPETESDQPQSHVDAPIDNGAPEVFYHTLEPPTDLDRPTYQNLSEVNHYTLNPIYESSENSAPLVEANKLYDNYNAEC